MTPTAASSQAHPITPSRPAAPLTSLPAGEAESPPRRVGLCSDVPVIDEAWLAALGAEGLQVAQAAEPGTVDAMVLRVLRGLPEQLARLREWRRQSPWTPLVVACHPLRELDQVLALEMGADDVVDAQWSAPVLAARLRALWRRARVAPATAAAVDVLRFGRLVLRLRERDVRLGSAAVPLTEGEFEVLWLLASHAGVPLSRRDILKRVRGLEDQPLDRSIDSRVYRIRAKLGDNLPGQHRIRTVRNRGYLFSPVGW